MLAYLTLPAIVAAGSKWGCGLLGPVPGISADGTANAQAQHMIDGLKSSSSLGKVNYWNWNFAPMRNDDGSFQYLTEDFVFMPNNWGMGEFDAAKLVTAGQVNFPDEEGNRCPATMGDILLGGNEPDIIGSCMGTMMGSCTGSCTDAEVASGCPVSKLVGPPAQALPNGHCDCWSSSHATGVGFWPLDGCNNTQPLPGLFTDGDAGCVASVMTDWKYNAKVAVSKGYKYLSAPLLAVNMDWMKSFVTEACKECTDISCGCPAYVAWHFYASDCRPIELGGYAAFENKLNKTKELMEEFPHLQGAIINEVGMLNCVATGGRPCIPNSPDQKYPANAQPNHACPKTDELPNGFATFVGELMDRVISTGSTTDGRPVVASFAWFNENMAGGTYNLQLFDDDGSVNDLGQAYIDSCAKWGQQ